MNDNFIKNIIINNKMYELENNVSGKGRMSGITYRLKKDNLDLAVKLYYHKHPFEGDDNWYPDIHTLEYFSEIAHDVYPIILSHYKVEDKNHNYVGCASPFINETRGTTKDAIWNLSRDLFFTYFYRVFEQIPKLSKALIVLDDWSIDNMRLGNPANYEEGIYCFDDSNYFLSEDTSSNNLIDNELIEDIVSYYIDKYPSDLQFKILDELRRKKNYIDFLEENSLGYENIGEFLEDYSLYLKKKYY